VDYKNWWHTYLPGKAEQLMNQQFRNTRLSVEQFFNYSKIPTSICLLLFYYVKITHLSMLLINRIFNMMLNIFATAE
jgi:hypothetical protein